jgi:hypothetical protein
MPQTRFAVGALVCALIDTPVVAISILTLMLPPIPVLLLVKTETVAIPDGRHAASRQL